MFRTFVHRVLEIDPCDCALIVDAEIYRFGVGDEVEFAEEGPQPYSRLGGMNG